jgi:transaldolase
MTPMESLLATGSKLWIDSIDPKLVRRDRARGFTGATSNPIIVADLVATGRFDAQIDQLLDQDLTDEDIAWHLTLALVAEKREQLAVR